MPSGSEKSGRWALGSVTARRDVEVETLLRAKQPPRQLDQGVSGCGLLTCETDAQQFPRFLLERTPMLGRARFHTACGAGSTLRISKLGICQ